MSEVTQALALMISALAAAFSAAARKHSKEANDAVNHRHKSGTPRLYDLQLDQMNQLQKLLSKIGELIEWKKGYEGGPLDSGRKVEQFMAEFDQIKEQMKCAGRDSAKREDDE